MHTTKSLLRDVKKAVKKRYNVDTNYRIAKVLEVSRPTVDRWDSGNTMDDDNAIKIAIYLKLDPEYVMACIAAERAKNRPSFDLWKSIVKKLEHKQLAA